MSGADVSVGTLPLLRTPTISPGQMGVEGTDTEEGLRLSTTGAIFYVDCNYPGASINADGTNPRNPLLTIQSGIDKCEDGRGDVVLVAFNNAWQYADPTVGYTNYYQEAVTLDKAGVRLMGISPSSVGVPWGPATALGTCLTVTAIDCIVEGFAFTGQTLAGDGIYCEWDGATLYGENLTVRHCTFDNAIDTAIQLEFSWYCDIHHNYFQESDEYGIYADPGGSGFDYCHIHHNKFMDCDTAALAMEESSHNEVYQNSFYNSGAVAAAASANVYVETTGGASNMIYDNWFACLLPAAANGDWNDTCTSVASDGWLNNHLIDGDNVTRPT